MAEFTPYTVPLGSLAGAAAASADLAQQEQVLFSIGPTSPTTTTGIVARPPDF